MRARIATLAGIGILSFLLIRPPGAAGQNEATKGKWHGVKPLSFQPVHSILLKDKRVLCIYKTVDGAGNRKGTEADPDCALMEFDFNVTPDSSNYMVTNTWLNLQMNEIYPGTAPPGDSEYNFFCCGMGSGHDGRVILFGGTADPYNPADDIDGHHRVAVFDPDLAVHAPTEPWSQGPSPWKGQDDFDQMTHFWGSEHRVARWYPSVCSLGGGSLMVVAGRTADPESVDADWPAIFNPDQPPGQQWTVLDGPAPNLGAWWPDQRQEPPGGGIPEAAYPGSEQAALKGYPFVFLRTNGKLFYAGTRNSTHRRTRLLDLAQKSWANFPTTGGPNEDGVPWFQGVSAVTWFKLDGDEYKQYVFRAGGDPLTEHYESGNAVYTGRGFEWLELTGGAGATWSDPTLLGHPNMVNERDFFYLVPLADGRLLATGGNTPMPFGGCDPPLFCADKNPAPCWAYDDKYEPCFPAVAAAEWIKPLAVGQSGQWTQLAAAHEHRAHHSSAILTPDARVFTAAGEYWRNGQYEEIKSAEIFSPPYLFTASGLSVDDPLVTDPAEKRPVITAAPAEIFLELAFDVHVDDNSSIKQVNLVRLGAATHSFDQSTRFVPLEFTKPPGESTRLSVTVPPTRKIVPAGYYMLFVLKQNPDPLRTDFDIPSHAHMLRIAPIVQGPLPPAP